MAANETLAKHAERFFAVDKTQSAIQEAMQSFSAKDKTDATLSEFKAQVQRMQALTSDTQDNLRSLSLHGPSSPSSRGFVGLGPGRSAQEAGEGATRLAQKPRVDERPGEPSACSNGAGEPRQKATSTRDPSVAAGRSVGGGPSADDRKTVVVRRLPAQVMRSKLPELHKLVLDHIAGSSGAGLEG